MGTELVPFKTWAEFDAAHSNRRKKARQLNGRFSAVMFGGATVVLVLLVMVSQISLQFAFILGLPVLGVALFERLMGKRDVRRNQIANLPNVAIEFPCPDCNQNYNLGHAWVCGWCKEIHNDWLPLGEMPTPASGCDNSTCQQTETHPLSRKQGDQAAVQCPSCARHIILDPVLYERSQCHLSPYSGVARFVGDTRDPVQPRPIVSVYPVPPGSPETKNRRSRDRLDDT